MIACSTRHLATNIKVQSGQALSPSPSLPLPTIRYNHDRSRVALRKPLPKKITMANAPHGGVLKVPSSWSKCPRAQLMLSYSLL